MKRWIALILTLILALSLATPWAAADLAQYVGNNNADTPLFQLSGDNQAGQEFVCGFTSVAGVRVNLTNTARDNSVDVTVYQGSAAAGGDPVYTQTFSLDRGSMDWYTFTFEQPLEVEPGVLYSFTLHTEKSAVWNGCQEDNACKALNYDTVAYGGWVRGNLTGFEVLATAPHEAVQSMIAALPDPVTDASSEEAVLAARQAYNALTDEQKAQVTNYDALTRAEGQLDRILNAEKYAVEDVKNAINAIGTVNRDSGLALRELARRLQDLCYDQGLAVRQTLRNTDKLTQAMEQYNQLVDYTNGDVDNDGAITPVDALQVLRFAVEKIELNQIEQYAADVSDDSVVNAVDALWILRRNVEKIQSFPADRNVYSPIDLEETIPMYSRKNAALYRNTYQSMLDRTHDSGYAQTSITGAYNGMFGRDSSIQIMAHVAAGDYDQAKLLMNYILQYHDTYGYDYILHIMNENSRPLSTKVQIDSTFFFLHAWYLFATQAPDTAENRAFLQASTPQIKNFAEYFLNDFYLKENGLFLNPSLEHSRNNAYWAAYDLLTNTYASQALHELSLYFAQSDPENAARWGAVADSVAAAIHTHLTSEIGDKRFYCEMMDHEDNDKLYVGFSWVNLAPMGCDWYAADPEILENTYQLYMTYGSCLYYRKYQMLDVVTTYNGRKLTRGDHVIGKGLAWEMLYCKKTGKLDRLSTLIEFVEANSEEMYRETWGYGGGGSDTANQEHASWMLYANILCLPELVQIDPNARAKLRVGTYNVHVFQDVRYDYATIARDIQDSQLDVVGLQEVDKNSARSDQKDQAKQLAQELGWYYAYAKAIDLNGGEYGHAILSRYPISDFTVTQLPSGSEEQRVVSHGVITVGGKPIHLFNTHLSFSGMNYTQLLTLADLVNGLDYYIVTGDFNNANFNVVSMLGSQLANNDEHSFVTCEDDGPIDNIVVGGGLVLQSSAMADTGNHSDHKLLYADVILPRE